MSDHSRNCRLQQWLQTILKTDQYQLHPLAGDASFRRYYTLTTALQTYVVMDAPPDKMRLEPYIDITSELLQYHIRVPHIYHQNLKDGFLIIESFGDHLLLNQLSTENADTYYQQAFAILTKLQQCPAAHLPAFDGPYMQMELDLFSHWFMDKWLGLPFSSTDNQHYQKLCKQLIAQAEAQPQTFVHLDYHSRNLMCVTENALGVLDFQDAKRGPITYDLVSLLRDAYIAWPCARVEQWVKDYYRQLATDDFSEAQFIDWFHWMSLQRLLKVTGIFARLALRDGKTAYLNDIPRVLNYLQAALSHYPALAAWSELLSQKILPHVQQKLECATPYD